MKTEWYFQLSLIVIVAMFFSGCSELKNGSQAMNPVFVYVHPEGFKSAASPDFHGNAIQKAGWEMRDCRQCHGGSYTGSNAPTCVSAGCHVDANGTPKNPESCNTCHGTFSGMVSDTVSWTPPRSISGDTATSARGVGAHQFHLIAANMDLSNPVACNSCHRVPSNVYDQGHFDSPAPVSFVNQLAKVPSGGMTPSPTYDAQSLTCNNTYCHGNWRLQKSNSAHQFVYTDSVISGANFAPQWTGGDTQDACGTCHGLPPAGHLSQGITIAQCGYCHYVTNQFDLVDGSGAIVNKSKHVNGKINVYGSEQAFR